MGSENWSSAGSTSLPRPAQLLADSGPPSASKPSKPHPRLPWDAWPVGAAAGLLLAQSYSQRRRLGGRAIPPSEELGPQALLLSVCISGPVTTLMSEMSNSKARPNPGSLLFSNCSHFLSHGKRRRWTQGWTQGPRHRPAPEESPSWLWLNHLCSHRA